MKDEMLFIKKNKLDLRLEYMVKNIMPTKETNKINNRISI